MTIDSRSSGFHLTLFSVVAAVGIAIVMMASQRWSGVAAAGAAGIASFMISGFLGYINGSGTPEVHTICYTANAGNPYPDNQQRAKATGGCNGITYYGSWVGQDIYSESPNGFDICPTMINAAIQKR